MRLNLGKNKLKYIPTDTFHPLTNLEVLDLHENRISQIPDGAFEGKSGCMSKRQMDLLGRWCEGGRWEGMKRD
ncbi:Leucine-rich repeat-containing protein 15 [Portunus trituberculatus]|uniref:Leucine-rich repeat-containing protein 15 n=1 Tax=Portunus trituberculatus TaxID=210409 RepID=A0A5B7JM52_PORTR|nr:Leucine-rich repeat-containing protein 15 [Portunus trituberculatus]